MVPSTLSFTLSTPLSPSTLFGPRLGLLCLKRPNIGPDPHINLNDADVELKVDTPGLLIPTSRGVVPHLSRDHFRVTNSIKLVNVPFESFLDHLPPIPTLQPGNHMYPLHKFLGFLPSHHILSMSARDPHDGKEMPPNGSTHISVSSLRGVRKLTPADWSTYTRQCKPDIVFALSDTPFTNPPYSQKRLTKSIERSTAWLAHLLHPPAPSIASDPNSDTQQVNDYRPNIFLQLAGSTSLPARRAFADSLIETLHGKEADAIKPLRCLDDGVQGYVFDLVPIRTVLAALKAVQSGDDHKLSNSNSIPAADGDADLRSHSTSTLIPLLQASLASLPPTKPRIVDSPHSPHEMLRLIWEVGIDVFDARLALDAANVGVALDFVFPASGPDTALVGKMRNGKRDLGHNLYEKEYEFDFGSLAGSMRGALSADLDTDADKICPCAACSPVRPRVKDQLVHAPSDVDGNEVEGGYNSPYTRAYIHHLLHTHEMAAHAWLVMHNIAVLDAFLGGVRCVLRDDRDGFAREVARFERVYDERVCDGGLFEEAKRCWKEVELARGKGRLAREKVKVEQHLAT